MYTSESGKMFKSEAREMEWTRDKTLELLREYKARNVLWDWTERGYRDRTKRKRAIQELAELLGCNILEVEKKVTNLKCQYSREVHKIQQSKQNARGPEDLYVSKWFAFNSMQFLQFGSRRYTSRPKTIETTMMTSTPDKFRIKEDQEYIVSDIDPEAIYYYEPDSQNMSHSGSYDGSPIEDPEESSSSSSLRHNSDTWPTIFTSQTIKSEPGTGERVPEVRQSGPRRLRDEFTIFGESIAAQLAEIPDAYSRSVAKLRINQILFEAEVGAYAQGRG